MISLKEEDFIWEPYYPEGIEYGLEGYDCTIFPGTSFERKYSIIFQYPHDVNGTRINSEEPELYILFECGSFIYAHKTLEDAKARAYVQYKSIFGYAMSFIE